MKISDTRRNKTCITVSLDTEKKLKIFNLTIYDNWLMSKELI